MKKLMEFFTSLKLKYKLVLVILLTLFIPVLIFSVILLRNLEYSSTKEQIKNMEYDLLKSRHTIEQNVEMCNLATQVIANSQVLNEYLLGLSRGIKYDTKTLLHFYKTEIAGVERIVNSNPYLHQIRIYVDSDSMPELVPLLFQEKRMHQLAWAKGNVIPNGSWCFNYEDTLFYRNTAKNSDRIVSLITKLNSAEYGDYAVAEVATTMKTMFPDIYTKDQKQWMCFVDSKGNYYYDESRSGEWLPRMKEAFRLVDQNTKEAVYKKIEVNQKDVIMGYIPIKGLDGHLLKLISMDNQEAIFKKNIKPLISLLGMGLVTMILVSFGLVELILKQFYNITEVMHEVRKGDLDVRIDNCQRDEIGVLGNELNQMLDHIKTLIEESIDREVLIKDTQILALQNQINAHFIYNVLESIKMMAEIDEKYAISDAVTSLGKLLRYSMRWHSQNVTVEEEIDYIKNYLALINLRFDYEIYLSINMPAQVWKQSIPKMSLQPIIENAIYHGIEEIAEDTCIYMKGIIMGGDCLIKITDSGRGMTEEEIVRLQEKIDGKAETSGGSGNGIGLKNVQDRIQISFGRGYGLSVYSKEGCYTQVIVKIPFQERGEV